jgi:transcriptional regulator with GAF, ATPase, and Fis domain
MDDSGSPIESLFALFEQPSGPAGFDAAFCRALAAAFDAEFASIFEPAAGGRALRFRCAPNLSPRETDAFRCGLGEGICGAAALTGRTIAVFDAGRCPQHLPSIDALTGLATRSLLAAPAIHDGRCLAVIELMNRRHGHFGDGDRVLARSVAALYAARLAATPVATEARGAGGRSRRRRDPAAAPPLPAEGVPLIVGASVVMQRVLDRVLRVGPTGIPVLVLGETGTGKELIARRLHAAGRRRSRPCVTINCAALTETLLESELFGHRKGAFTGADRNRTGKLAEADGGTVFLDEVGDMSPACQAKLLRALDYGEISPVGGNDVVKIDVRIIAATNQPLQTRIEAGSFRADLYYRLRGVELTLPPLRERAEDVALLTEYFLRGAPDGDAVPPEGIDDAALELLTRYPWPGNVRELRWAVRSAAVVATGRRIGVADLPPAIQAHEPPPPAASGVPAVAGPLVHPAAPPMHPEARRLLEALTETAFPGSGRWNLAGAARLLGMPRKTLEYKIKRVYRLQNRPRPQPGD